MLFRCLVMMALAATGLALAACAETGSAVATEMAAQGAEIAATQAVIASTQALEQLQAAATQMSASAESGTTLPSLPNLPSIGKGLLVIDTPQALIVQKDGHRYILLKTPPPLDDDADR